MPYNPTPLQELQKNWFPIQTLGGTVDLAIGATAGASYGSVQNATGPANIKSRAIVIAQGPPGTTTTGQLPERWRINAVNVRTDAFVGLDGSGSRVTYLLAKIAASKEIWGVSNPALQVTDPFVAPSSTAGPSFAAAQATLLGRHTITAAAATVAATNVNFDLTVAQIVATTAANTETLTDEDFVLGPGERLVLVLIPTGTDGASEASGTGAIARGLCANVLLQKLEL